MGKFSSPEKQAGSVMKKLQGDILKSVGTCRGYESCLTKVARWLDEHRAGSLREMTREKALSYLNQRAQQVGQSTLDQERQAIQAMFRHVTGQLHGKETLQVIKSSTPQQLETRAYTKEQIQLIVARQSERNALATEIAHSAGLRAAELLSLTKISERDADQRPTRDEKFQGRAPGERYTVHGKGGLIREVHLPQPLAARLEARRLPEPRIVTDRRVRITQNYDLGGGNSWSKSFSDASKQALGWSAGGHGNRHSYAQDRMQELKTQGLDHENAKEVVSQELGHFRPEITDTYLR